MVACLQKCKMNQLATELRVGTEEGADPTQGISEESMCNFGKKKASTVLLKDSK